MDTPSSSSPLLSPFYSTAINTTNEAVTRTISIPVEIVSEEEMAFIEAALASTRPILSSSSCYSLSSSSTSPSRFALFLALPSVLSPLGRHSRSLRSAAPSQPSKTRPDIEDSVGTIRPGSLLHQFRSRRALMVTDITATEWCEKQMEFVLLRGKPRRTQAMKTGSSRHAQLEKEVVEKVEVRTRSTEDAWAIKLMNFIVGSNQLLFEGLSREIPVLGVVEGIWMVGVIDEIRMSVNEAAVSPFLVDTKTRVKVTLPSEAQKRNARLQLMCYKYLWDSLVADTFPTDHFFNHFDLNPLTVLSKEVKDYIASLGFHAKVFGDVLMFLKETCSLLSSSQEQLILRYELQSDHSLLEEYQFAYDASWFKNQIQEHLEFWLGAREASYVSEDEKWKCQFCTFSAICPMTTTPNYSSSK